MKNGYAIKELIVLFAILAVAFGVAITRVSYAYQDINDNNVILEEGRNSIKVATEAYVKTHEKDFKKDADNFIFGKDLIENGYLIQTDDFDFHDVKIKVTYNKEQKKYTIDIVE